MNKSLKSRILEWNKSVCVGGDTGAEGELRACIAFWLKTSTKQVQITFECSKVMESQ